MSRSTIANKLGDIKEVLKAAPELNNFPVEMWENTHQFLKQEGFGSDKFAYMIGQNPKLLTSHEKIFQSLNEWRAFQLGERDTITLLARFPELLNIQNSNQLNKRIETIKKFVGGGKNVFKVLLNSPEVVSEHTTSIEEKIDYMEKVMKLEPFDVCNSAAFSCDILKLKTRHIFLQRLGLFIVKKRKDSVENSKNPKLSNITDTSDKRFATKVCHVLLEEYETFQDLYKRELDKKLKADGFSEDYEEHEN